MLESRARAAHQLGVSRCLRVTLAVSGPDACGGGLFSLVWRRGQFGRVRRRRGGLWRCRRATSLSPSRPPCVGHVGEPAGDAENRALDSEAGDELRRGGVTTVRRGQCRVINRPPDPSDGLATDHRGQQPTEHTQWKEEDALHRQASNAGFRCRLVSLSTARAASDVGQYVSIRKVGTAVCAVSLGDPCSTLNAPGSDHHGFFRDRRPTRHPNPQGERWCPGS